MHLLPQTAGVTQRVEIYTNGTDSLPGTLVAAMTNPDSLIGTAVNIFTAPANTTLSASTTYWVVIRNSTAAGFRVWTTTSTVPDSGAAAGWSLGSGVFKNLPADTWGFSSGRHRFEIRGTEQTTTTNTPPTVANAIPDQTTFVDSAFAYAFPDTTFSDELSYEAKQADDTALPPWLTFTDSTRAFSGTPTAADTVSVKVTASDGNGGSVSDEFDIRVVRDPNAGICGRTEAVRDALLAEITGVTDCALVTDAHLAAITGGE